MQLNSRSQTEQLGETEQSRLFSKIAKQMRKDSLSEDEYERNGARERENEFDKLDECRSEKSNWSSGKPLQPIQLRPIVESSVTPEEEAFLDR